MVEIPGVYIAIRGNYQQLPGDMAKARQIVTESAQGMSKALDGALSPRTVSTGVNKLIDNLGQLSRSSKTTASDFGKLGVDLKQIQSITGITAGSFQKLQARVLQTQGYRAQEKALRDIAKAADLTNTEIRKLGAQFGVSHAGINRVVGATTSGASGMKGMAVAAGSLVGQMALMVGGLYAGQAAIGAIAGEFKRGLQSIEDFNLTVAASAAYITTFSEKAKQGDLAGAFKDANEYAGQLATKLEMIDSQTIASGKDLQTMSETFVQHGVLLDINNKKQVEGFTNIATALALVTAGQNKDIQMRQEINALLMGQIRATDRLPKLLKNIDPNLEKHLVLWKQEGTLIENVGKLLEGFSASTGDLDKLWATVGSTMETIHNRILRGAFKPIFEDLISLAQDFNKSLQDTEGNLTPLAVGLQKIVSEGYEKGKEGIDAFDEGVLKLIYDFNLLTVGVRVFKSVVGGIKDAIEDFGSSDIKKAKDEIEELKESLTKDKAWYEFSFLPDPKEENRRADEIKGKISELQSFVADSEKNLAELRSKSGGGGTAVAPTMAKAIAEDLKEQERLAKSASSVAEKMAEDRKRLYEDLTDTIAKEGMDQTQIELYELNKRYQANLKTAGDNIKLQQLATQAYQNELKKRTKADADYNAGWAAFQNRQQQQFVDGWQGAVDRRKEAEDGANQEIVNSHQGATSVILSEWSNAYSSIQSSAATMIRELDFSLKSIVDIVKDSLAQILAAILMSGIKQAFANLFDANAATTFFGGLSSGVMGAIGSGDKSPSSTPSVGTAGAAGWGSTLGGTVALAGGAYGLYSGAKNIKDGNAAVGAVQTGLGGYSAYQGAVTLGMIEKGTASGVAKGLAAKFGYAGTSKIAAGAGTSAYTAGSGATSYGTFQAASTTAGTAGGASGASGGMAAGAAGAAAYAVPIAAAVLVAMGAYSKSQRPKAQNEIDKMGITPADLGQFYAGWRDIKGTIIETIPVLGDYQTALYDANSGLLVAQGNAGTLALSYHASAEAGQQWELALRTGNEAIRESIIAADEFSNGLGVSAEGMGKVAEIAYAEEQAMSALSAALNGSVEATAALRGEDNNLALAANGAANATSYMAATVQDMGSISQQAANQISGAWKNIEGLSADAKSFGAGYVVGPSTGQTFAHADGGIFTKPARIGNHVFGESGMEALIPLPSGPDTMTKLLDRLDRIEKGQSGGSGKMLQPIIFNVSGQEIKRVFVPIIDEHVTPKVRRNQLGERTAYAAR